MPLQLLYRNRYTGVWYWGSQTVNYGDGDPVCELHNVGAGGGVNPVIDQISLGVRNMPIDSSLVGKVLDVLIDGVTYSFSITSSAVGASFDVFDISSYMSTGVKTICASVGDSSCDDDSDCEKGEKCVDGECVPCDEVVDGKGVVTIWAVKPLDGSILTDGLDVDISSGVASVHTDLMPTAGRIQIFNGMSGTLTVKAGIGVLGSDFGASITLFSGAVSGHYQDFIFDFGNIPFGYLFNGRITFEILNYDTLGDCADDDVDDTPGDAPIDVVDGGEPQPPGGSGPGTVTPPGGANTIVKVIVIKPSPPDNGCECEKYLADALYYNFDSLGNCLIDLTNTLETRLAEQNTLIHSLFSDHNRILFEQFSESNRLSYELSLFFAKKFYPQLLKISSAVESLSSDVSTIKDSLRLPPCEPDYPDGKTIAQIADEFVQKYEPVDVVVEESDVWQQSPDEAPRNYPRKL